MGRIMQQAEQGLILVRSLPTWLRNQLHRASVYLQQGDHATSPSLILFTWHTINPQKNGLLTTILITTAVLLLLLLFIPKERQKSMQNSQILMFRMLFSPNLQWCHIQILAPIWFKVVLLNSLHLSLLHSLSPEWNAFSSQHLPLSEIIPST